MTKSIFPPWDFSTWTDVDDRVRGGSSTSHLEPVHLKSHGGSAASDKPTGAKFFGHLGTSQSALWQPHTLLMADIDTLGGAGFASQRYRFGPEPLHLPRTAYKGIKLTVHPSASSRSESPSTSTGPRANKFTLVLKTTLNTRPPSRPKVPPQPEPASLSYEASFTPSKALETEVVHLAFDDLKVVYRGREVPKDDPRWQPFHPEKIYELSLMCRSDFGDQKGDFELVVGDITGWEKDDVKVSVGGKGGSQWRVISWARAVWATLGAIVVGFWIWAKGAADGKIALPDEEKDPLI